MDFANPGDRNRQVSSLNVSLALSYWFRTELQTSGEQKLFISRRSLFGLSLFLLMKNSEQSRKCANNSDERREEREPEFHEP